MNKKKWLIVGVGIIIVATLAGAGYLYIEKNKKDTPPPATTANMHSIDGLKVTYELSPETQKLYDIIVISGVEAVKQNVTTTYSSEDAISISGKACNNTSGAIAIVAADKVVTNENIVVKTLNDGRKVLTPQTKSTLMACTDITPANDDQALVKVFNDIAASLQSY